MFKLGIIGGGFVGGATSLLGNDKIVTVTYDINPERCSPLGTTFENILKTEAVFICVWTPMIISENEYGKCDTKLVEKIINQLKSANYSGYIIVRSTVPVGFSKEQNVFFMPEFLTEKNWRDDFLNCENWIFGWNENSSNEERTKFSEWIRDCINCSNLTYKNVTFVSSSEAEAIKYFRNCFLATKVSFCNEFYKFCLANNLDYDTICESASKDKRIGNSHTQVPGPDGRFGFGGNCFTKDMASLEYQMKNIRSDIISAVNKRNNEVDRV